MADPTTAAPVQGQVLRPSHGGELHLWQPGRSGNPKGRTDAVRRALQAARDATPDAIAVLVGIMANENEESRARIVACCALLDRGMGRPGVGLPIAEEPERGPDISQLDVEGRRELAAALKIVRRLAYSEHEIEG